MRALGQVEHTINGNDPVEWVLWCEVDARLQRRMKRVAARNGGELLVGFYCRHEEFEDASEFHDDGATPVAETELTCLTECAADVARRHEA